eukprot:TRINITY_DN456_c0_g1_i2.p1 TRINITY_DN456_c0_g1~~TRINITY_DN456_c0_g1_i2.p1  ORF type:complete len:652 (-),score=106.89 TRINITY_DN456_c0_g1_i2:2-1957(-)
MRTFARLFALFLLFSIAFCEEEGISFPAFSDSSSIDDGCSGEPATPPIMDTAQVQFFHQGSDYENVSLYMVSTNCYQCEYEHIFSLAPFYYSCYYTFSTEYPLKLELIGEKTEASVTFTFFPGEQGVYLITFETTQNTSVVDLNYDITVVTEPMDTNKPIWVTFGILGAMAIVWPITLFVYKKLRRIYQHSKSRIRVNQEYNNIEEANNGAPVLPSSNSHFTAPIPTTPRSRLTSLDTFRGLSLTVMIFVNFGGGGYWFFDHSLWNGLTVADLVFPWFVFIMGVAMPMSFAAMKKKGVSTFDLFKKSLKRSLILFGLGVFLNNGTVITQWRIPGVLQRFGGSYFFVSLIMLFVPTPSFLTKKKDEDHHHHHHDNAYSTTDTLLPNGGRGSKKYDDNGLFADILPFVFQWLAAIILLVIWLMVTFLLYVPGCGRGYLGPGGIGNFGEYKDCTGGAAGYIDSLVFGPNHIYCYPTCMQMYRTGCYDPEGLLGYLTSIFLCFLGVTCGRIFHTYPGKKDRIVRLILWGVFWGLFGSILCGFKQDGGWIPISKNLWSVSFIFVMAGTGFLMLCLCYILVDVLDVWNGAPFKYPGMNSIVVYCGSEILAFYFPFHFQMSENYNPQHSTMMLQNVVGVSVFVLLSYIMYLNKVFINI